MVKTLARSVRECKKDSLLSPIFVALEVVMEVIIPILMGELVDEINSEPDTIWGILKIGGILVTVTLVSLCFGVLSGRFAARASAGFAKNLRKDMYYRVQKFSFTNIDKFSPASIVTRLTTDITNVQNAFQMIIRVAVRCPFMLVFALIMSFRVNSKLSPIFLCVIPLLAIGLAVVMTNAHPVFERVFKTYDKLNNIVQENLHGIRVVKSFNRENHEKDKFNAVSDSIYKDFSKAEKLLAAISPLMMSSTYICMLLISWFGAKIIIGGNMTTGELTSLVSFTTQILMSLMMVAMVFVMIVISRASAERIVEILRETPDITDCDSPLTEVPDGSVSFHGVGFSYSGNEQKLCLSNINFDIRSGETVGIIGATGSSKTTLVQLIPRLYDVTTGTIEVGGNDVRRYDIKALRDEVAMVLQKNVLFSGTIAENLRWGDENASDAELERVCRLAAAHDFVSSFPEGYNTHIEQGGTNVSGGQKQRLCIARALLKKPKILILDDSTSAVDTKTDSMIRRAFATEIPETTKIIIAQRVASIENADKIIVLDNGGIDAIGTHSELLESSAIYKEVYDSQTKGGR